MGCGDQGFGDGGVETPATGTATVADITDTTATINYDVTLNDDTSAVLQVYPGTTNPTGPVISGAEVDINVDSADALSVTGLTATSDYLVSLTSALNETPVILTTFSTIATGGAPMPQNLEGMNVEELKEEADKLNLQIPSNAKKAEIKEMILERI